MKAKILISDPLSRWEISDVGIVLENDSTKYNYKILLTYSKLKLFGKEISLIYYFFSHEVEIIDD